MKLVFLGTAGSVPSKRHNTVTLLIDDLLLDCGEGTLRALERLGLTSRVRGVFITHLHADHVGGLVSLIWHYMLTGREEELLIAGPRGLRASLTSLLNILHTPLERVKGWLKVKELEEGESLGDISVAKAAHTIPALAFRIDRRASICYSGDTSPSEEVAKLAEGCDLLIHDAMYPPGAEEEAHLHGHSSASEAGEVARRADVEALALVHLPYYMFEDESFIAEYVRGASRRFEGQVFVPEELKTYDLT